MPKNNEHIPYIEGESAEQDIILDAERSRQIGAKVLATIHYEDKNRNPIVASSYEKARKNKEKFPDGSSAEQRNLAHLRRLDRMIEKGGSKLEKRIWQESIKNIDLVQTENITESTWLSIQQENRNHGRDIKLTPELKEITAQQYRDVQLGELEDIANYLSAEECPYPRWYKIYVWNGLTSLSRKTKNTENSFPVLQKRDKTTTAGFPKLSPAAIAKVYDDITSYYDIATDAKEAAESTDETDGTVEKLVKNGSFAKLYSYELSRLTKSVEVPEKTEDVHGEWIEYDLNRINDLTEAAEGTPWCIVSPTVAKNYLEYGTFSHEENDDLDDDWDDDWDRDWNDDDWSDEEDEDKNSSIGTIKETRGRFVLFHLTDPNTGLPSKSACASIRIDPDGNVAEISGICGDSDQRLNDSLVPIVKEKVMQYPGGERMMQAFLDNEEIIHLDEKSKKGEPLTEDEINFIFENNRKIETLNPYGYDPRIKELRDVPALLANGVDANILTQNLPPSSISPNIDRLLNAGADINDLVPKIEKPEDVADNVNRLLSAGAKIEDLVSILKKNKDVRYYDTPQETDILLSIGADIDLIVSNLSPFSITDNLEFLLDKGATIDIDNIVSKMPSGVFYNSLDSILDAGVSTDIIMPKLDRWDIVKHCDKLLAKGLKPDDLLSKLDSSFIADQLDNLLAAGIEVGVLIRHLASIDVLHKRKKLLAAGASEKLIDSIIYKD